MTTRTYYPTPEQKSEWAALPIEEREHCMRIATLICKTTYAQLVRQGLADHLEPSAPLLEVGVIARYLAGVAPLPELEPV